MQKIIVCFIFAIMLSCNVSRNIKIPAKVVADVTNVTITAKISDTCYRYYYAVNWGAKGLFPKDSITFTAINKDTFPIQIYKSLFKFEEVENLGDCSGHWLITTYQLDSEDMSFVELKPGEQRSFMVKNNNFPKSCYSFEENKSYKLVFSYKGKKILSNSFKVCKVIDANWKAK